MKARNLKRTKIVATIGPATSDYSKLKSIIKEGVDVCRLNFSHGAHEDHQAVVNNIRKLNYELSTNICLLQDLQGPKLRIGEVAGEGVVLKAGREIEVTTEPCIGTAERLYVSYEDLPKDVKPGEPILIDDGKIELKVIKTNKKDKVWAKVKFGGLLTSKKGFNLPSTNLSIPSLTEKDRKDLQFGLKNEVEWIGLSFVRSAHDIHELKKLIKESGASSKVIAKIEKPEAIKDIDQIIAAADGIMVARGDLGVEMPMQTVPIIQKDIVKKCIVASKPVIIATQMMESMISSATPTRAEVNDVANAVMDGADAVMLSAETSVGRYPVKVVQAMRKIVMEVEQHNAVYYKGQKPVSSSRTFLSDEVCFTAVRMSDHLNAKAIVGMTRSGYTGYKIASFRPKAQIFIFTNNRPLLNTLSLVWGVQGFYYNKFNSTDETFNDIVELLHEGEYVKRGDLVINTASMPIHEKARTNAIKVNVVK